LKKIILFVVIFSSIIFSQPQFSSIQSLSGSFSRMGFGARGIGMGNALSAVTDGNLVSYYNPAVSAFQDDNSFHTSYSILSLDRSLNFLNFTRRFDFYSMTDTAENRKPRSSAGISAGIINAGVSNIDERDNQGFKTGTLSTSENQFFIGFANRFSEKISLGVAVKFYYFKLYNDISSNAIGLDIGALYKLNNNINFAFVISDINTKYEWDTGSLYGPAQGVMTKNSFPVLKKFGASYKGLNDKLLVAAEYELSSYESGILKLGAEYSLMERFILRGGIDQFNLVNSDYPVKPAAGFSYFHFFGSLLVGVHYAFMLEQYSAYDRHIVGLNLNF
jgi:hypothetical protein